MRHGALHGPLSSCLPGCDVDCVCDEPCCDGFPAYSFLDDGTRFCMECFDDLDARDEYERGRGQ